MLSLILLNLLQLTVRALQCLYLNSCLCYKTDYKILKIYWRLHLNYLHFCTVIIVLFYTRWIGSAFSGAREGTHFATFRGGSYNSSLILVDLANDGSTQHFFPISLLVCDGLEISMKLFIVLYFGFACSPFPSVFYYWRSCMDEL